MRVNRAVRCGNIDWVKFSARIDESDKNRKSGQTEINQKPGVVGQTSQ
jgi:hypothetical protein